MGKKWSMIVLILVMVMVAAACGGPNTDNGGSTSSGNGGSNAGNEAQRPNSDVEPEYTFKVANVLASSDISSHGLDKFAELVEQKSDGKIQVELFHGGQLGSGAETFEAVKNGNLDMAADSFANLASITPAFEIFHMPFLFESRAQALAAFNSDKIKERVDSELAENSLKWFTSFEIGGPREVGTSKKKIEKAEDFHGMKLRASRSPLEIAAQEAWGATGVTVDWPETPESVRLGMVDGLTVPYASFHSAKFHEGGLIKYMLDLNFQWYSSVTVINKEKWESLPEEIRTIMEESAQEAQQWHIDYLSDYISEGIKEMREAGVEIYSLPEAEFNKIKEMTKEKVWNEFIGTEGIPQDKLDLILSEIESVTGTGWGYELE